MSDAADIIRAAMQAASRSSLVLDFGARPGLAVGLVHNLRAAGINPTWDGATLTIPIADVKTPSPSAAIDHRPVGHHRRTL
jgi:hypothetical protein